MSQSIRFIVFTALTILITVQGFSPPFPFECPECDWIRCPPGRYCKEFPNPRCAAVEKPCLNPPCPLPGNFPCCAHLKCVKMEDPKCPGLCARVYKPVCGTDGKTYNNACLLGIATCKSDGKITLKHKGKCECPATCASVRCKPRQRCVMKDVFCKSHNGTCCPVPTCVSDFDTCDYPCIAVYKPVCGTDGRTYSNSCELSKATCKSKGKIQFEHEGKCFGGSVDFLGTGF